MSIRLATITTVSIVTAVAVTEPTFAQERGGARFNFTPNYYRTEQPRIPPRDYGQHIPHSVRTGSVPRGPSFLGLSPQLLAKPIPVASPVVQTRVAARPSFTQATPQITSQTTPATHQLNPAAPSPFRAEFGKPLSPPVIANLPSPAVPQHITQKPLASVQSLSGKLKPRSNMSASKSVSGILRHKPRVAQTPRLANALKPIQSYGNMGFVPGPYTPASSGSGMTARADVKGTVLKHNTYFSQVK